MAVSRFNRSLVRPITISAAIIGTIEALLWTALSLVSVLFYHSVILVDTSLAYDSFQYVIHRLFLDPTYTNESVIVTTEVFNIFMYIYIVLSFLWLLISLYMLWAMLRDKWQNGYGLLWGWSGITLMISVLDIILMSLVAADFSTMYDFSNQPSSVGTTPTTVANQPTTIYSTTSTTTLATTTTATAASTTVADPTTTNNDIPTTLAINLKYIFYGTSEELATNNAASDFSHMVHTSYGLVMSVAARGYILWIVNIIFAIVLIKFAYDIKKDEAPSLLPIIDAYTTSGRPWSNLYEQTDIGNGYSNAVFKDDNEGSIFPRSDSFVNNESEIKNYNPLSNGSNPYYQDIDTSQPPPPNPIIVTDRLAKIGKQGGRRTPPQNIPPPNIPYIPEPDYTPPGSPKSMPKSVLRPKSNYVL